MCIHASDEARPPVARQSFNQLGSALLALGLAGAVLPAQAANNYQLVDLGEMYASGMNDLGQVVGSTIAPSDQSQAIVTGARGQGLTILGTLAGDAYSNATGINNAGQVVGTSFAADGRSTAFLYQPGQTGLRSLGTLAGDTSSSAVKINASGQVVGLSQNGSDEPHAYITSANGGQMNKVDTSKLTSVSAPGDYAYRLQKVTGVNDAGQVIGIFTSSGLQDLRGFVTGANGQDTRLINDVPLDINNTGHIAGFNSRDGFNVGKTARVDGQRVPFSTSTIYHGAHNQYSSLLPSEVTTINDDGLAGGYAVTGLVAGYWTNYLVKDAQSVEFISTFVPGLIVDGRYPVPLSIVDINNAGDVLLSGRNGHAYIAFAVPEPATVSSMMLGLLAIGALVRRKAASAPAA